jgi:hypothetical protein
MVVDNLLQSPYWIVLLCKLTRIHGRFGWKAKPLARLLLLSNCSLSQYKLQG